MQQYLDFLNYIMQFGVDKADRTGVGIRSVFSYEMRFDLGLGFPALTTKKIHMKSVIVELLWFLSGDTNISFLKENGVSIWDEWADDEGNLGPVYGEQWRKWKTADGEVVDQIQVLCDSIKTNPNSRRHILSAWNVGELKKMALPPCHAFVQFYVANGRLSCKLTQRSADAFLGVPFNIASYSLLTHMLAQQCDLAVGEFIWSGGDCHVYQNHFEQVKLQLGRTPAELPQLKISRRPAGMDGYRVDDFMLIDYVPQAGIKAPIAV